ncbi:hypothetical protein SAMN05660649_02121 [Desulfotomaculum arcticum]|uniref:Uncharacterized protein n=2 Tax=Desulfotruncus TaxID=2867377 RepID=A0A1I2TBY0_9FIRM|nr:hypothetical protein SAMN05660649_02121 [Desulfotomaculum arcticum] [Desulfotruncus arcticus DSM 17038]
MLGLIDKYTSAYKFWKDIYILAAAINISNEVIAGAVLIACIVLLSFLNYPKKTLVDNFDFAAGELHTNSFDSLKNEFHQNRGVFSSKPTDIVAKHTQAYSVELIYGTKEPLAEGAWVSYCTKIQGISLLKYTLGNYYLQFEASSSDVNCFFLEGKPEDGVKNEVKINISDNRLISYPLRKLFPFTYLINNKITATYEICFVISDLTCCTNKGSIIISHLYFAKK